MKQSDIVVGQTYLFLATDSPARKHLEGKPFTVTEKKAVFRKFYRKGTKKVNRYFNADGIGARAEELEPLPASLSITCTYCGYIDLATEWTDGRCPECGEAALVPGALPDIEF
jgi:rubrerythrin